MTAGRDSRGLSTAIRKRLTLIKCPFHFLPFYLLAFAIKFCQTSKELTLQPELHHRVVILQPPPSLDCGLDGQSLFLDVWFFNCPTKAMMLFLCFGDSSSALFLRTCKTLFHFQAGFTPQDAFCVNFCPCRNSWMKTFYTAYCYFAFSTRISTCSTLKERDCFYFVTAGFVIWEFGFSFTLVNRQRRSNTHRIRYEYPTWQYFSLFHSYLTLIFLTKEIDPSTAAHTGVCGDRCSKRGYTKYKLVSPLQFAWRQCLIPNQILKIV